MLVRALALLALVLLPAVAAHADPARLPDAKAQKAAVKCHKAIDQSASIRRRCTSGFAAAPAIPA